MLRDSSTLEDIVRAARLAIEFKESMDREAFLKDMKPQAAVLHQLMVIGEAVKRLSDEFRSSHPEVPWGLIARMRDKLIHGYDIVDLEEVWKTTCTDIPDLLMRVEALIEKGR
jgi:uncharacterized protein with HEPN domain